MNDHTTLSERKATKAPAIVAFLVGLTVSAAGLILIIFSFTGSTISPAVTGAYVASAVSAAVTCVAWAMHRLRRRNGHHTDRRNDRDRS